MSNVMAAALALPFVCQRGCDVGSSPSPPLSLQA